MIRNFIYLDSEKLRSLSSQLFEGVTDYVLKMESEDKQQRNSQKGPVGSGQVLADIFSRREASSQLTFLEDHAYVLFEERLVKDERIAFLKEGSNISFDKQFVRVSGKLLMNDIVELRKVMNNFNEFGEAMYRIVHQEEISVGNRGKALGDAEVRSRARQAGMQMDKKFLEALETNISYAFENSLEAQILVGGTLFSAPLKRECLREAEKMLVSKFSRKSQCDFAVVGVITQRGGAHQSEVLKQVADAENLREAMRFMVDYMRELESSLTAPLVNEVVLDPVAIYMEV